MITLEQLHSIDNFLNMNDQVPPLVAPAAQLVSLCRASDIFVYITTFLDAKALRSLCISTPQLKDEKYLYSHFSLTRKFSVQYYENPDVRRDVLHRLSSPQRQLSLNLSNYKGYVAGENMDVSALGNVHTLNLLRSLKWSMCLRWATCTR